MTEKFKKIAEEMNRQELKESSNVNKRWDTLWETLKVAIKVCDYKSVGNSNKSTVQWNEDVRGQ